MLQKTADEFLGSQRAILGFAGSRGLVAEGHLAIRQLHNALVADGYPEDVRRQILQGGLSVANWLAVHNPIPSSYVGGDVVKAASIFIGSPNVSFHRRAVAHPVHTLIGFFCSTV